MYVYFYDLQSDIPVPVILNTCTCTKELCFYIHTYIYIHVHVDRHFILDWWYCVPVDKHFETFKTFFPSAPLTAENTPKVKQGKMK